jgi:hypothetical protein
VRYRAKAHVCNACPRKAACTDSGRGREVVRPIDPWPHSEAGRFHRVIALLLVGLGVLIVLAEAVRHHRSQELALLLAALVLGVLALRRLGRDLRAHPAGFPTPSPAHGLRMTSTGADRHRERGRWGWQRSGRI